jgi:hypothetical protein
MSGHAPSRVFSRACRSYGAAKALSLPEATAAISLLVLELLGRGNERPREHKVNAKEAFLQGKVSGVKRSMDVRDTVPPRNATISASWPSSLGFMDLNGGENLERCVWNTRIPQFAQLPVARRDSHISNIREVRSRPRVGDRMRDCSFFGNQKRRLHPFDRSEHPMNFLSHGLSRCHKCTNREANSSHATPARVEEASLSPVEVTECQPSQSASNQMSSTSRTVTAAQQQQVRPARGGMVSFYGSANNNRRYGMCQRRRLHTIDEHKSFHLYLGARHRRHLAFDDTVFAAIVLGRIAVPPPPRTTPPTPVASIIHPAGGFIATQG